MLKIKQVKALGVILGVVLVGVGLFDLGFSYMYKESLELGSCDLCFKLNPDLARCENYKPLNFSNLTLIPYEK